VGGAVWSQEETARGGGGLVSIGDRPRAGRFGNILGRPWAWRFGYLKKKTELNVIFKIKF